MAPSRGEKAVLSKQKRDAMTASEMTRAALEEPALNLRGSWNHSADDLLG
jgi:hypothetical protein